MRTTVIVGMYTDRPYTKENMVGFQIFSDLEYMPGLGEKMVIHANSIETHEPLVRKVGLVDDIIFHVDTPSRFIRIQLIEVPNT